MATPYKIYSRFFLATFFLTTFVGLGCVRAQTRVVLDNFFNHEVHAKTGQVFHYTWTDKDNSGFSEWGDLFKQNGAELQTLQQAPTGQLLANADLYIIVDPDTKAESPAPNYIQSKDIASIADWVKKGGVLVLMANDSGNCEFTHLNTLSGRFGIHFNEVSILHVTGKNWDMGAVSELPSHPIFKGVHKLYLKEVSTLDLTAKAQPVLKVNGQVLMAETKFGKGHVFAVTDPWIYNEYIGHRHLPESFDNETAARNLTQYLISLSKASRK